MNRKIKFVRACIWAGIILDGVNVVLYLFPSLILFQGEKNVRGFIQALTQSVTFQVVDVIEEDKFRQQRLDGWL